MSRRNWSLLIAVLGLIVLLSPVLQAQPKAPSAILNQYRGQRTAWFTAVFPFANSLFGILATIEFAWSAAVMLLEKSDMQSWTSALIRKLMWIGAFYMLLINGRYWIPAITDSFEILGQQASGNGPMSPSDVFTRGIDIAGALMAQSSSAAFFENLGTSLAMIFTGIVTALAFIGVAIQFVVAMVESYVVVAAGLIFLGFGGSRWTAPYVERYIGLGVAIGVKIMLIYLLIGAGMSLSVDWMNQAQAVASAASPAMSALEIMGASVIFMMLCWQIPKLFSAVLGGSPALSGGDLISTGGFVGGGALAIGSLGMSAIGAAVGGAGELSTAGAAAGGEAGAAGSGAPPTPPPPSNPSPGGGTVPPPTTPPSPSGGGSAQPAPPQIETPSGVTSLRRRFSTQIPPDSAPHAAPPRMPIDHAD
jgi:type IV secretion system protein TrbL